MDQQQAKRETSQSRRRLLKGSAGAPILGLLVSRPVLGTPHSCSPSGFASANIVQTGSVHGEPGPCSGLSPGYWMNHWDWPGGYQPGMRTDDDGNLLHNMNGNHVPDEWKGKSETNFLGVFGVTLNGEPELTLMEVLRDNGVRTTLEFHAIAALLNAADGQYGDMLDPATVADLYNSAKNGMNYDTGSGVMTPDQIEDFLISVASH